MARYNPLSILPWILGAAGRPDPMGGQALIEGVMMRSKEKISVALRRKSGAIETRIDRHLSWRSRHPLLKLPVLRGAITFVESLVVGMRYLNWSADIAAQDDKGPEAVQKPKSALDHLLGGLTLTLALVIGVAVFMYSPILIAGLIDKNMNPLVFNLAAGAIRILFFVAYVWAISLMKDVRRVFQYHGAEHKCIFAFEAGESVNAQTARKYGTRHPRCGTSFLLIAGLACIVVFAFIDALYIHYFGPYHGALHRVAVHLLLVPFVSGISFEALRFSGRYAKNPVMGRLILPGLWLQGITTVEPDDAQLETAAVSLNNAL